MTSPRRVPIFDGHNDVLLRLYRRGGTDAPRAFLEGGGKGQLDLPMARQGGFVGGLFAIFVPSSDGANGPNDETASQRVSSAALSAPAVELAPAQTALVESCNATTTCSRHQFRSTQTSMLGLCRLAISTPTMASAAQFCQDAFPATVGGHSLSLMATADSANRRFVSWQWVARTATDLEKRTSPLRAQTRS